MKKQPIVTRRLAGVLAAAVVVNVAAVLIIGGMVRPARSAVGPFTRSERQALEVLAQQSTFEVQADRCDRRVSGSGFLLEGRLVTSRHIVAGATSVDLGGGLNGEVLALTGLPVGPESIAFDLAIVGGELGDGAELAGDDPEVGTPVFLAGWVDGELRTLDANVHLYTMGDAYGLGGKAMLLEPAITFGFSGGPIFDRTGRVVGLLKGVDLATGLTVAVPSSILRSWHESNHDVGGSISCMKQE